MGPDKREGSICVHCSCLPASLRWNIHGPLHPFSAISPSAPHGPASHLYRGWQQRGLQGHIWHFWGLLLSWLGAPKLSYSLQFCSVPPPFEGAREANLLSRVKLDFLLAEVWDFKQKQGFHHKTQRDGFNLNTSWFSRRQDVSYPFYILVVWTGALSGECSTCWLSSSIGTCSAGWSIQHHWLKGCPFSCRGDPKTQEVSAFKDVTYKDNRLLFGNGLPGESSRKYMVALQKINLLMLFQHLAPFIQGKHVMVRTDSHTTMACITGQGGILPHRWSWCSICGVGPHHVMDSDGLQHTQWTLGVPDYAFWFNKCHLWMMSCETWLIGTKYLFLG